MRLVSKPINIEDEDNIPKELLEAIINPNKYVQAKTSIGYIDASVSNFRCGVTYRVVEE
tara:strand:- start:1174 stop:1350 length:177 start_codon:yes stop_codon:yes gene_type:complete